MSKIVYVKIENKYPDDLGRQGFWLQWWSTSIGVRMNEEGLRGQYFFGNLSEHFRRWTDKGYSIEYCEELKQ